MSEKSQYLEKIITELEEINKLLEEENSNLRGNIKIKDNIIQTYKKLMKKYEGLVDCLKPGLQQEHDARNK